jgi:competence protein ComEA
MIRGVWLVPLLVHLLAVGSPWPAHAAPPQDGQAVADGKVNINTASKTDLMKLHGVGPGLAEKIIEYRKAHGPFQKPEDIRKIQGIGKGLWEKNRDAITVK